MEVLKIIITVIFVIVCLSLSVCVLAQEGKSAGLSGSISGLADTYWGKNRSRSKEGGLLKATIILGAAFIVLSIVLNVL